MLPKKEIMALRRKAHHLKPVVLLGQHGLTDAVQIEIERAIAHHELIKIKVPENDRTARKNTIEEICKAHDAELIQIIGKTATIYRKKPEEEE